MHDHGLIGVVEFREVIVKLTGGAFLGRFRDAAPAHPAARKRASIFLVAVDELLQEQSLFGTFHNLTIVTLGRAQEPGNF